MLPVTAGSHHFCQGLMMTAGEKWVTDSHTVCDRKLSLQRSRCWASSPCPALAFGGCRQGWEELLGTLPVLLGARPCHLRQQAVWKAASLPWDSLCLWMLYCSSAQGYPVNDCLPWYLCLLELLVTGMAPTFSFFFFFFFPARNFVYTGKFPSV